MPKTHEKHAKSSPDDAQIIPESSQNHPRKNYFLGKIWNFIKSKHDHKPSFLELLGHINHIETLPWTISIIWQSMGSWGLILIMFMQGYGKYEILSIGKCLFVVHFKGV